MSVVDENDSVNGNEVTVHFPCRDCHTSVEVVVPLSGYRGWRYSYMLIQNAFPELSETRREMLMMRLCESCVDDLFEAIEDLESH